MIVFLSFFSFVDVYYAIVLCESIDFEIVKYMCFLVASKRFQVLLVIICDVRYFIVNFASICRKCDLNRSLLFNWIFNISMFFLTSISWLVNVTSTIMSYLFDVLVKWISSCFRFANFNSCFCVHRSHLSYIFDKV